MAAHVNVRATKATRARPRQSEISVVDLTVKSIYSLDSLARRLPDPH